MYPQRQHSPSYPTLRKLSWWHESIIDWMLLRPEGRLGDCAREFDVTQSWLSIIVNSDLFRARLAIRRAELAGEIGATVIDRLSGIAGQALESIAEKIEKERTKLPIGELRETASMALNALGYGAKSGPPPMHSGNVYNFHGPTHVSRDVLESARQSMRLIGARTVDAPDAFASQPALLDASAATHPALVDAGASVPRVQYDDNSDPLPPAGTLPSSR